MVDREKVIKGLSECITVLRAHVPERYIGYSTEACLDAIELLKEQEPITGETSDGYHTFNELYHHRAVLFSVIVANYPERAWKAKKHHDGAMYDGMFIVGIETPDGQATYHYDIDPYWNMFDCKVREFAPEWDGHTPAQAIERIGRLALLKRPDCEHAEHDGAGCLGYAGCEQDDEPIDICKKCDAYTGNKSERAVKQDG